MPHPTPIRRRARRGAALLVLASCFATVTACQPAATVPTTTSTTTTTTTSLATTTSTAPLATAPPAPVTSTTSTTVPASGWTLVGGDEFDGSGVDGSKWKAYNNTYGDGNHELACLTPNNVTEGGGALTITAKKEQITCPGGSVRQYTSGFVGSRETGTYYPKFARFEMRAKLPHAQGLWPAFWLRHRNGASVAEVDIMEYFHATAPGKTYATLHLDGRHNLSKNRIGFESPSGPSQWHTWAVEISPAGTDVRFDFYMDNILYHSYTDTQHNWASADPASTWDIALNMAVGGDWTGDPDGTLGYLRGANQCAIGGTAPDGCITTGINRVDWNNPAADSYQVDYVRVYTR